MAPAGGVIAFSDPANLYWSVIQQDQLHVALDVATCVLEFAVRHDTLGGLRASCCRALLRRVPGGSGWTS